jgi:hypothetical protein
VPLTAPDKTTDEVETGVGEVSLFVGATDVAVGEPFGAVAAVDWDPQPAKAISAAAARGIGRPFMSMQRPLDMGSYASRRLGVTPA